MTEEKTQQLGELVIQYDPATQMMRQQRKGHIPLPLLVNFLEIIKTELVLQELALAQQAAQQQAKNGIVIPNGPMPNFRNHP